MGRANTKARAVALKPKGRANKKEQIVAKNKKTMVVYQGSKTEVIQEEEQLSTSNEGVKLTKIQRKKRVPTAHGHCTTEEKITTTL